MENTTDSNVAESAPGGGSALDPELEAMNNDPEYEAWVHELAKECTCSGDRPCDGLMAGGLCDDINHDDDGDDY